MQLSEILWFIGRHAITRRAMPNRTVRPKSFERSRCPIAVTLDTLGDRWSLVIVRDLFAGKRRFSEFLASPEGIKRNILAERLKRLESAGILRRIRYQQRPDRFEYHLTKAGAHLLPIIQSIARWAHAFVPGVWEPSAAFLAWQVEQFEPEES
jgi:DNA-binding HxlR family transcriptional regulator